MLASFQQVGSDNRVLQFGPRYLTTPTDEVIMSVFHRTTGGGDSILLTPGDVGDLMNWLTNPAGEWTCRDVTHDAHARWVDDRLEIRIGYRARGGGCGTARLNGVQAKQAQVWLEGWADTSWTPELRAARDTDFHAPHRIVEAEFTPTGDPAINARLIAMQQTIARLEGDKDKLAAALANLTHHPAGNPGPCIEVDCVAHMDAAVHHTPARVLGLPPNDGGTPAIGAYAASGNPIEDAATLIATSVYGADRGSHSGWGCRVPAAKAAALDLLAAGWTPPLGDGPDEALRHSIAIQQSNLDDAGAYATRMANERDAADAFRVCVIVNTHNLADRLTEAAQMARAKAESAPTYGGETISGWLDKIVAAADRNAGRAHRPVKPADSKPAGSKRAPKKQPPVDQPSPLDNPT